MYLGIDIGGTKCALVKGIKEKDGSLRILEKIRFETRGFEETLNQIFEAAEELLPFDKI